MFYAICKCSQNKFGECLLAAMLPTCIILITKACKIHKRLYIKINYDLITEGKR